MNTALASRNLAHRRMVVDHCNSIHGPRPAHMRKRRIRRFEKWVSRAYEYNHGTIYSMLSGAGHKFRSWSTEA